MSQHSVVAVVRCKKIAERLLCSCLGVLVGCYGSRLSLLTHSRGCWGLALPLQDYAIHQLCQPSHQFAGYLQKKLQRNEDGMVTRILVLQALHTYTPLLCYLFITQCV